MLFIPLVSFLDGAGDVNVGASSENVHSTSKLKEAAFFYFVNLLLMATITEDLSLEVSVFPLYAFD